MDEKRELMRHALATVAYRAARALAGAPEGFAAFAGAGRTPVEILAHMGDLIVWSATAVQGHMHWHTSQPLLWPQEQERFFASLRSLDSLLASGEPIHAPVERLLQGPIADALTHVGQLAMLRRLAGSPTRGENFYVAAISAGQVDAEQLEPIEPFR
jgi:hypothetical protein